MSVGNSGDAKLAWNHHYNDHKLPQGWSTVGSGSTRTCYRSPDDVVYKVGETVTNLTESRAARRLRGQKRLEIQGVVIPKARCWPVKDDWIVAMEYVEPTKRVECGVDKWTMPNVCDCRNFGTPRMCFSYLIEWLQDEVGLIDMFWGNIILGKDNRFYIIDLGAEDDYDN